MTAHRRQVPASTPDLSPEDILALRRQSPDYVAPPPAPVSWEAFLAWTDEDTHAEWVDGEIVEMPPVVDDHQFILGFIYRLVMEVVDEGQLGLVYLDSTSALMPQAGELGPRAAGNSERPAWVTVSPKSGDATIPGGRW